MFHVVSKCPQIQTGKWVIRISAFLACLMHIMSKSTLVKWLTQLRISG